MSDQAASLDPKVFSTPSALNASTSLIERALTWAGDRLNPILVKETRQALQSKQFVITFTLVLICAWCWSILGVAMIGPEVYYAVAGPTMFTGYYLILAFPLLVIVPFGAFRSLAGETEDRTYELLSITTLRPAQIISGKLGSTAVQMLVYLSAVAPCLGFTYMLRGVDFPSILLILTYTVLISLGLSVICLLAGTFSTEKHWQVILSVLLIIGLLLGFWFDCLLMIEAHVFGGVLFGEFPFDEPEFWQINAAILTAYLSYFALIFLAAAAQLTFSSDNRSTRLRVVMVLQHVLFAGWMSWVWLGPSGGEEEVLLFSMVMFGLHWYFMGVFLSGESPVLSHRVKRALPQSFLGRVFLTWFNPGPGTGYLLVVSSLVAAFGLVAVAVAAGEIFGRSVLRNYQANYVPVLLTFGALGLGYVTFFLGLGTLLLRVARKVTRVGLLLTVLTHFLLLLSGIVIPLVVQLSSPRLRASGYTLVQISNPLWTLIHVGDQTALPPETPVLLVVVLLAAFLVFLANLPGVAREVEQVRIAKPVRVAEEDAQREARRRPPEPVRRSPWDE